MPYLVNGQLVLDETVRKEEMRLCRDPQFQAIPHEAERLKRLRAAAELAAVDITLVEQIAAHDPRPIDPAVMEREMQKQRVLGNCRSAQSERQIHQWIENEFRLQRTAREMIAGARRPSAADVEEFYQAHRENFRGSAVFQAAHIVKHTDGGQNEDDALACIKRALAELEDGAAFAEVAERYSDCKGRGGDLGEFLAGTMVAEFEDAIRDLQPGQRTGIFRTPFGFHIAELRKKHPAGPVDFEEVREDIRRVLTAMREHQEYMRVIAVVRSRADIRWIPESTPATSSHEPDQALAP